ncbi:membrane protein insertase YidC [Helicobacter mustelae]|uniref:Membrane protein insertase YidC n=1 Tax=Helicobacter mustelae (strain ATCC 43772 / CCUG 25715 / CIP 103759 / LMG 18044 / NCTC 12198 / R85-136P) TaxID=679897 RepID=D3UI81_HELM1|nr:membrane protein insertase YidC [Helicobacter mustelae]CBG40204.1 putative inner-membrane protein, OxaA [Helicobacter mustelae 12198]SQH71704.1 Inner membrane protein translocase component YidC, long form [Helicobacter mustelae]
MKNNSNLRIILAVAFSFIFIAIYSRYFVTPQQNAKNSAKNSTSIAQNQAPVKTENASSPAPILEAESKNIIARIQAKEFDLEIDSLGRIAQVYLKNKKYTGEQELGFFEHFKILLGMMQKPKPLSKLPLFHPSELKPLEIRFANQELNLQAFKTSYEASKDFISLDKGPEVLVLTQKLPGLTVKKTLTFYENLKYDIQVELSNPSENYFITNGARPMTDKENYAFNGVILEKVDGKIEKIEDKDAKELKTFDGAKFVASVDRYFTTLFYAKNSQLDVIIDSNPKNKDPMPYVHATGNLGMGGFIGPKDYQELKSVDPALRNVVEYGLITFFAKPVFLLLEYLHQYIGNWGWAIITLTVIVKLVLYPLSYKGMVSMQKLKDLTPKMKEIQEKYKGDPQKLQMHMMQLYKKHGANPMGGCLPLLIQIPIFYAIYRVLYNSVELKSAPFILWIQDLSVMDPYFVLPILMGVSMYVQQALTPNTFTDPIQAKVFKMLPVVFTIFLIFFPAGLVLYWTINNILSIFQQLSINKMLKRQKQKEIAAHKEPQS